MLDKLSTSNKKTQSLQAKNSIKLNDQIENNLITDENKESTEVSILKPILTSEETNVDVFSKINTLKPNDTNEIITSQSENLSNNSEISSKNDQKVQPSNQFKKDSKICKYFYSGYLKFSFDQLLRIFIVSLLFIITLACFNNSVFAELFVKSLKQNILNLFDYFKNLILEIKTKFFNNF